MGRQRNVARDISCFEALWQPTPSWIRRNSVTHRIRRVGHIQMWPNPNQILWRSWACIKMQSLETFSVITVYVRIFSGLDRNDLMYPLRICEIFLFMNAKVLFLVICLVSAILYVTRHLVIYEGLCLIFGRSRHEKKNK